MDPALGVACGAAVAAQLVALGLRAAQCRAQPGKLVFQRRSGRALQRQEVGKLLELHLETHDLVLLAGDFLTEEELRDREDRNQEDENEQQRRQRIDEARPVIDPAVGA